MSENVPENKTDRSSTAGPYDQNMVESNAARCPYCGAKQKPDAQYCSVCGVPLQNAQRPSVLVAPVEKPEENTNGGRKKIFSERVLLILVACLAAAAFVIVVVHQTSSRPNYIFYYSACSETPPATATCAPAALETPAVTSSVPTAVETNNLPPAIPQERINTYLSNFSEQAFGSFSNDSYTDMQLIEFAWTWTQINRPANVLHDDGTDRISDDDIAYAVERFFGKDIIHQSTDVLAYDDGQYSGTPYLTMASNVTIVDMAVANGNGTFTVRFTVYDCKSGVDRSYYAYDSASAQNSSALLFVRTGTAVVKPSSYDGKSGYCLLQYS